MEVDLCRLQRHAAEGADRQRQARRLTRRIAVIGNTCSGKTTLARALAERLGVPHVELDALFWRRRWEEAPADEFRRSVEEALGMSVGWIVDGNFRSRLGTFVLDRTDLVVWLDPPLAVLLVRILRRTYRRIRSGERLWGSNVETWRNAFLRRDALPVSAVRVHRRWRRRNRELATRYPVVRLHSRRDVERFLADVG